MRVDIFVSFMRLQLLCFFSSMHRDKKKKESDRRNIYKRNRGDALFHVSPVSHSISPCSFLLWGWWDSQPHPDIKGGYAENIFLSTFQCQWRLWAFPFEKGHITLTLHGGFCNIGGFSVPLCSRGAVELLSVACWWPELRLITQTCNQLQVKSPALLYSGCQII